MLVLDSVDAGYGNVHILHGVSLHVGAGEVLALLGRNGAGKTTTLKAIMGLVRRRGGSVSVDGADLARVPAHEVPRHAVAYVPQGRRLFGEMTVAENLRMGLLVRGSDPAVAERALDLFPDLRERLGQRAGTLSGGQQQMLATARALCVEPKVLLLDEPSEGLQPSLVDTVMRTTLALKARGVAVLLVEQKVGAALQVADRVAFLENGRVVHESTPGMLDADPGPLLRHVGVQAREGGVGRGAAAPPGAAPR